MDRFLCIAGCVCGQDFLQECAEEGARPTLLTTEACADAAWPREALEDLATMPPGLTREQVLNTVFWMARGRQFNRVVALDEESLPLVAEIREHMRLPGMGQTTAGYYRDRLAMHVSARESGFAGPEFCRIFNYDELREFMSRVPAPWVLKPRARSRDEQWLRIGESEQLWRVLDRLGDRQSHFLLEELLEGDRLTVESIIHQGRVVFSVVLRRRQLKDGAVRQIETVDRTSREWTELSALDGGVAPSLGMVRGMTESVFVWDARKGRYCFEEIAAGVGAGLTDRVVEAASGLNLWREWARLEVAHLRGENYVPSAWLELYGAALEWPAGSMSPDLQAEEVVERWRAGEREYAVLRSLQRERVEAQMKTLCRLLE